MNTIEQALRSAIEALEDAGTHTVFSYDATINECKSALSEIEKCEPVAYRWKPKSSILWIYNPDDVFISGIKNEIDVDIEPLYASPISKEWVGLTDAEAFKLWDDLHPDSEQRSKKDYWLAIEAKLKQLNAQEKG